MNLRNILTTNHPIREYGPEGLEERALWRCNCCGMRWGDKIDTSEIEAALSAYVREQCSKAIQSYIEISSKLQTQDSTIKKLMKIYSKGDKTMQEALDELRQQASKLTEEK